ncbi:helix-turn-helix domain-containing protein [Chitinimonas sp.]|uniref:TetR/AcrR family transcriptional regulator n=1 Tax=Chitinimonas sp. TaxID=1934313 RepID=UPI002F94B8D2
MSATTTRRVTEGPEASARLLDAADELFYRDGIRAVGVDAIVKQAGVNKMSLYRQFSSKDELVRHYFLRADTRFWTAIERSIAKHPDNAAAALQQIYTDLAQRAVVAGYRGCPFVNMAAEFTEPSHFVRQLVAQNKRQLLARLEELATQAGASQPLALAQALALLLEGAYAASQSYDPPDAVLTALPEVARQLIGLALQH